MTVDSIESNSNPTQQHNIICFGELTWTSETGVCNVF